MVLTRRAQSSGTPSPAPSPMPADGLNPQSSLKMNKELQRLLIDGNEKMGGVGSSSPKRSRRSNIQHQQSPTPVAAPSFVPPEQAPKGHHQRLSKDVIPPTPPLSDKDAPMRPPPPRNPSPARRKSQPQTTPAPKARTKSQTPKPSTISTSAKSTPSKKRTINDYFSKKPPESDNKRRKVESPAPVPLISPIQQSTAKFIESLDVPPEDVTAIPTTEELPAEEKEKSQESEPQEEPAQIEEQDKNCGQVPEARKAHHVQPDVLQEREQSTKKDGGEKKNITWTREMKRLQIDAKEALLGAGATDDGDQLGQKRKRRHTTAPNDTPAPPNKRPRQSLPASHQPGKAPTPTKPAESIPVPNSSSSSSSIAEFVFTGTDWIPAPTTEQAKQIDKYVLNHRAAIETNRSWDDIVADLPTKNSTPPPTERDERILAKIRRRNDIPKVIELLPDAPVWRKNNEAMFLGSGEVNPAWISNWLEYVSAICDGPSLEDIPLEARMIPERRETELERNHRIEKEEGILEDLAVVAEEQAGKKRKVKGRTTHVTDMHVRFGDEGLAGLESDGDWKQRRREVEKEKDKSEMNGVGN